MVSFLRPSASYSVHSTSSLPRLFFSGTYLVIACFSYMVSSSLFFHAGISCSVFISLASFSSLRGRFFFFFFFFFFFLGSLNQSLSPASPSPLFSRPQFTILCRCCACRSPLLVAYLPSPLVRGAVLFATFFLLLLFRLRFSLRGLLFLLGFLLAWDSFCSLCFFSFIGSLPLALPLSFLGPFYSVLLSTFGLVFI